MKYIIYNYFPSGLFVCLSWISFLIPVEIVPGRIALLVTLLLALINMFNSSLQTQPNTKAITAMSGLAQEFFEAIALLIDYVKIF